MKRTIEPQDNPMEYYASVMSNWDRVRKTAECPNCQGSGLAPGDGMTECGFCE